MKGQFKILVRGSYSQCFHRVAEHLVQAELCLIQLEFPRLDFREIKNIVDQAEQ